MLLAPAGPLIPMTVSMIAAMPAHWSDLPGAAQNPFVAPVGLALHMVYRAGHASGLVNQEPPSSDSRHVDDPAFMLLDGVGHLQRLGRGALGRSPAKEPASASPLRGLAQPLLELPVAEPGPPRVSATRQSGP
jgi:hypothetical protein